MGLQLPFLADRELSRWLHSLPVLHPTSTHRLQERGLSRRSSSPHPTVTPVMTFYKFSLPWLLGYTSLLVSLRVRAAASVYAAEPPRGPHHFKADHSPRKRALWAAIGFYKCINSLEFYLILYTRGTRSLCFGKNAEGNRHPRGVGKPCPRPH